jgi:hypothetical protein
MMRAYSLLERLASSAFYFLYFAAVFLFVLFIAAILSGCAGLHGTGAQKAAADAVNKYCAVFPYDVRVSVNRPEFAKLIEPHKAEIHCYGDPENPRDE